MKMEQVITKILEILEQCDDAIMVAQLVLTAVLTSKCSYIKKHASELKSEEKAVDNTQAAASVEQPLPQKAVQKRLKSDVEGYVRDSLDLFFSTKAQDEMTEEEKRRCNDMLTLFEGLEVVKK